MLYMQIAINFESFSEGTETWRNICIVISDIIMRYKIINVCIIITLHVSGFIFKIVRQLKII